MARGDGRVTAGLSVATQTSSARAVRSMHPEVTLTRAGSDNLDLIPRFGDEQGPSTPERMKVSDAAAGGGGRDRRGRIVQGDLAKSSHSARSLSRTR